jgi:hypothetical protein
VLCVFAAQENEDRCRTLWVLLFSPGLQTPFTEGTQRLFKGSMWHVDAVHDTLITTGKEPTAGAWRTLVVVK